MVKRAWILTGNEENWEIAISDKIWGVREGRLKIYWDQLEKGDLLIFYAKSPVGGLIGIGIVESKFKQDKPLWPDEIREQKVIYPYRFGFNIIHYLPDSWKEKGINVGDLKLSYQAGLNPLSRKEAIDEILRRVEDKWGAKLPEITFVNRDKKKSDSKKDEVSIHNQIRDKLYAIGQLKGFISEKEYSIDGERLDVTWRKVARGVPTKVFEVQVGGNIHQALAKLKHSWDLWNSDVFLIIDPKHRNKTNELLSGTFHEIAPFIKIIEINNVEKLYESLINEQKILKDLGIE